MLVAGRGGLVETFIHGCDCKCQVGHRSVNRDNGVSSNYVPRTTWLSKGLNPSTPQGDILSSSSAAEGLRMPPHTLYHCCGGTISVFTLPLRCEGKKLRFPPRRHTKERFELFGDSLCFPEPMLNAQSRNWICPVG